MENINKSQSIYVDHEIRIKSNETAQKLILDRLNDIDKKIDSQFKWIISTIITLYGGIILRMANII